MKNEIETATDVQTTYEWASLDFLPGEGENILFEGNNIFKKKILKNTRFGRPGGKRGLLSPTGSTQVVSLHASLYLTVFDTMFS
jgi:hypothetical protein